MCRARDDDCFCEKNSFKDERQNSFKDITQNGLTFRPGSTSAQVESLSY